MGIEDKCDVCEHMVDEGVVEGEELITIPVCLYDGECKHKEIKKTEVEIYTLCRKEIMPYLEAC